MIKVKIAGRRDPRYAAWHDSIALQARGQTAGLAPLNVPCRLQATFYLRGDGVYPDLCNLVKALKDRLQGPAIVNDKLIAEPQTRRIFVGPGIGRESRRA